MEIQVLKNEAQKGIEAYFESKPSSETIERLKTNGWRWHNIKKCWYAKETEKNIDFVKTLTNQEIKPSDKKEEIKKEKVNIYGIKVGDVFCSSWGYDQTNVDFFQVVEIKEKMVKIREIAQKVTYQGGAYGDKVTCAKNSFLSSSSWCSSKDENGYLTGKDNEGTWKKVHVSGTTFFLIMSSFAYAYLTNEEEEHEQTGSGFGH